MTHQKVRIGLFGTGDFGPFLAPYITEVGDLVAICDPNAQNRNAFVEKTGLHVAKYENPEQLFDEQEIDAVVLTSPNHTHKHLTIAAAQRGKHVFCEKAMAPTVADCWEMVRACKQADVRLMVGHKRRLRPPWGRMIELKQNLGPVHAITYMQYHDARPYNFGGWWTRKAESGGILDLAGVHEIDFMRAMCGDVKNVCARTAPPIDTRYNYSDTIHVLLQFHTGAIGSMNSSLSYPLLKFREACGTDVICQEGGMRLITFIDHIDLYWQHQDDTSSRHERFHDLGFDHAFRKELGDFVSWIIEGNKPCLTWREGLRCVEVMEGAHQSANQDGTWLQLPLHPELEV